MGTDSLGSEGGEQGDWTQSHVKGQRAAGPQGAGSTYKGPGGGNGEGCRGVWGGVRGEEATLGKPKLRGQTALRRLWTGARLSKPPSPPHWGTSAQLWAADSQHPALTSSFQTPHAASKVSEGGTRAPENRDCSDLTPCCP